MIMKLEKIWNIAVKVTFTPLFVVCYFTGFVIGHIQRSFLQGRESGLEDE